MTTIALCRQVRSLQRAMIMDPQVLPKPDDMHATHGTYIEHISCFVHNPTGLSFVQLVISCTIILIRFHFNMDIESKYKSNNDSVKVIPFTCETLHQIDALEQASIRELDEALSFRAGIPFSQKQWLNLSGLSLGVSGLFQPVLIATTLSIALFGLFCLLIFWRLFLILIGIVRRIVSGSDQNRRRFVTELPCYTVMIAAYNEAAVMRQLAKALQRINWPKDQLEIFILLEADDADTFAAAQIAPFPKGTRIIQVPPGGPRTKPNALNYGLERARGRFVAVYDVEDLPHPDQLRAAHAAFEQGSAELVCVQAPLRADNGRASWLAAHWALDYDVQFGLLLPGLSLYHMPLPIGGTSNHFRREALLALGGWDAWNVTEDADLGMRIARAGLRTAVIHPATMEDAPTRLSVWLPQRGRWMKGFLQTWLVLMRTPKKTCHQMGIVAFLTMQLSLGGAIIGPLAHLPFLFLLCLASVSGPLEIGVHGLALFWTGYAVALLGDLAAPGHWSWRRVWAMLTKPVYWLLLSLAAYRAVWELASRPFFWAKTPHQPRHAEPASFSSIGSSV